MLVLSRTTCYSAGRAVVLKTLSRFKSTAAPPGCWLPICGVDIRRIPMSNSEKCRVASFLAKNFFPHDPIMKAAGLKKPDPAILQYYLTLMNENMSLYAQVPDSREILGVAINSRNSLTTTFELKSLASRLATDEARRYMSMMSQLEERGNVFKTYQIDKAFAVEVLAVGERYRRRGIGQMLLEESVRQAKNMKYPMVKASTGSSYAQRAALTCELYKKHFSRPALSFRDDRGLPWVKHELCPPHQSVDILIADVRPKAKAADKKDIECDTYGLEKYDKKWGK
uniref:RNA-directed RNA polymerase L n=1 Tax=Lygus hesperus TaxID=30085 RepID=A0A0A9Y3I9_LYGHE